MIYHDIERIVNKIIEDNNICEAPVNLEQICHLFEIDVEPIDADDNLSGFFVVGDNNRKIIGYNKSHNENRRRFTIAHELGHFYLHFKGEQKIFIDNNSHKFFRNEKSSSGEIRREREANAFAAALLMPSSLIENEIEKLQNIENLSTIIKKLSTAFKVSQQSVHFRIINLGIIDPL